MEQTQIEPGLRAEVTHTVRPDESATALGSGDVEVYGTPAVVALVERAAVTALVGALPDGSTSVGTHIELDHLAPTAIGGIVEVTATLIEVSRRTLTFTAEVNEREATIARAVHTRVIVDRESFGKG